MLLDHGLRTNPVYNFANSRSPPLSGPPGLGQAVMMRPINKNFETLGDISVDSAIPKKGEPLSPKIGGDILLPRRDPK